MLGDEPVAERYIVQTFGCQMNVHDSRRIEEVLHRGGYRPTDDVQLADVIVINTCSVREKAEHKLMSLLGKLRPISDRAVLAVAGCVAQQEGERLLKKAPFVDLVIGPDNIPELPELLRGAKTGGPPRVRTEHDLDNPEFLAAKPRDGREVTSFVTVMKGCDERCTFCIVPTTRGAERYRSADDIVAEIAQMVEGGTKEVTLLGQTVNSWYDPSTQAETKPSSKMLPSRSEFAGLLRRIEREVPGLLRLRYTSPHPRHLTDELIAAHAELELLPAHVHLPVQSGSERVLKRMARRYTPELYIERARKLMAARPGLTMSTDFIVGFPGETEADFQLTLDLVREVGFVAGFCFKYSPRPFTPALHLGDDVSEEEKDDRLQRLFAAIAVQQKAHLDALVGSRANVLVEGPNDASMNRYSGRSERHEIVHLEAPEGIDPTGQIVEVTVEQAYNHSLLGRMDGRGDSSESYPSAQEAIAGHGGFDVNKLKHWAPALGYMALIFTLSSFRLSAPDLPEVPMRDKWIHLVEYLILGFLCAHAALRTWPDRPRPRAIAVGVLIAVAWGLSDELHQAFVPGRSSEVLDFVADTIGASIGGVFRGGLRRIVSLPRGLSAEESHH